MNAFYDLLLAKKLSGGGSPGPGPSPTPGGGGEDADVRFIDYDGTIVDSYSASEFAALTEMPANPSHAGLVAQGWNWTLADAKAQVEAVGACDIGQMYVTESGATEIDVELASQRLSPVLGICINGTASVDWGDGSEPATISGSSLTTLVTETHEYATPGKYTIKINVTSGNFDIIGGSNTSRLLTNGSFQLPGQAPGGAVYQSSIKAIRFGNGVRSFGSNGFKLMYGLETVTIPDGVLFDGYATYLFGDCYDLKCLVVPTSGKQFYNYALQNCSNLKTLSLPGGFQNIGQSAFGRCDSLTRVCVPSSVVRIAGSAFEYCYALKECMIPDGVIAYASGTFRDCQNLKRFVIGNGITSLEANFCVNCYNLKQVELSNVITYIGSSFTSCRALESVDVPSTVTTLSNNAFQNCYSLKSVTLHDGLTSIGANAFNSCYCMESVTIPSTVTNIAASAFGGCCGVKEYHVKATTPPTLGSGAFSDISSDCTIYVPAGTLSAYQAATNWSTYASKMVEEA